MTRGTKVRLTQDLVNTNSLILIACGIEVKPKVRVKSGSTGFILSHEPDDLNYVSVQFSNRRYATHTVPASILEIIPAK